MNHPPTEMNHPGQAAPEAKRFTYAGGSRPLDGFTIKRGVGHGGFGEVYYATSDAGKEVALKLIRRSLDVELRGIKQCLNLKHPNLLGVFDIKEDDRGDHWVVMEYVAGDCLDDVIAKHPDGMPPHEALAWLSGIAAGVGHLHDHGIVHRDLKPGNIFSEDGRVSIGDYGLSKFISCSRRSGHTESVGTVHYMAPEVANGRYGKEIDVYALGIILYEMLTGRVPFEGESVGEVLMKHLTAKPDVSMLEEPYRGVVARALEKDPEKRFSSVEEMVAALPIERSAGLLPHARVTRAGGGNGSAGNCMMHTVGSDPPPAVDGGSREEPILRASRRALSRFWSWQRSMNENARVLLLLAIVLGLMGLSATAVFWWPLALLVIFWYGIYWIIRAIIQAGSSGGATGASTVESRGTGSAPVAPAGDCPDFCGAKMGLSPSAPTARRRHYRRFRPYEKPARALIVKPPRERLVELLGSMLLAAVVAMIVTLVIATLITSLEGRIPPESIAFVLLVGIAGSWAVMVPAKFWAGTDGDAVLRRFIMMTIGLGLGGFAWVCIQWLAVDPGDVARVPKFLAHLEPLLEPRINHNALPLNCLILFGALMLLVRWWRQADPLRRTRLSLWYVLASMFPAFLLICMKQPAGVLLMIAGVMSISIQIASPWVNPRLRQASAEE